MDTRWKSRLLLAVWALLLAFGMNGILTIVTLGDTYSKKDYFATHDFQNELGRFISLLNAYELNAMPIEEAQRSITVTPEEIDNYRNQQGDLLQQISEINNEYDQRILEAIAMENKEAADLYTSERNRLIEEATQLFESDEYAGERVAEEKERQIEQYYRQQGLYRSQFLQLKETFKYRLKDIETGELFANIAAEEGSDGAMKREDMLYIQEFQPLAAEAPPHYLEYEYGFFGTDAREFEGQVGVTKSAPDSSDVLVNYNNFQRKQMALLIIGAISAAAIGGMLYLYRKHPISQLAILERYQPAYTRIPLDVRLMLLIGTGAAILLLAFMAHEAFYYHDAYRLVMGWGNGLVMNVIAVMLFLMQCKMLKGAFNREAWSQTLLYRGGRGLQEAFLMRSVAVQQLILLLIVFGLGAGLSAVAIEPEMIVVYIPVVLVIGLPILWLMIKRIGYFNTIVYHSSEVIAGHFGQDLPVKGKSVLAKLAENINVLKRGVEASQQVQAKNERLKTELITNVSHDLRTPLTSIISYTALLKQEEMSEEDRKAFVEIIDRKSQRLKVLIDDLFEASKMASGHVQLTKEKIDLVQLLQQALAESNEAMKSSTLQFRVTTPDAPLYAMVDGQKLWRVFDNLIGNCLKYSLEHSRVYLSVTTQSDKAVIVFKNVSKYEQSEHVDELFERFKRGDASRHTEGSGLGLAIAKSIVDLHEGRLDIEVDGDLFKVTIELSLERR
ncbi:HAMP domain-containing sensor histidine kinase [Paenibacillus sp. PL2-23]|uniref:sensor histidine kinase n=1 Tax=Paenibacillus sp. PL2-23 TaxID=2100729 RepID=UPI0030F8092D